MRASENLAAIALARGEKNERRRIGVDIDAVLGVIRGLAMALTHLTWVSSGYGWLAVVAPILIAAPVYFSGNLTFGGLMMAVGAFNQVNTALRWYIDNFGPIASWKATLQRVSVFRNALIQMDSVEQHGLAIDLQRSADNEKIRLRSVTICRDAGGQDLERGFRLREAKVEIGPGDRLMINGEQGVNRRLLFAAMAGLWPWGQGRIEMPEQSDTLFIAQHGYLPTGSLREILAYPRAPQRFAEEDYVAALTACGLGDMAPRLDENIRWDKKLDSDEQASIRDRQCPVAEAEIHRHRRFAGRAGKTDAGYAGGGFERHRRRGDHLYRSLRDVSVGSFPGCGPSGPCRSEGKYRQAAISQSAIGVSRPCHPLW